MSGVSTPNWPLVPLCDLGEIRLGKMLDKSKNQGSQVQYLRNINVRWFQFDLSDLQSLRVSDPERELLSVRDGDLFICEGGEPGRCAVWQGGANSLVYQKALHRFRSTAGITPKFLMYRLRHEAGSGTLKEAFTGTTIKHLTRESLSGFEIPLPPLNEQQRIADKLDAVLARVDACRDRLDRIPAILKRFRQSVLAAATSGKLTEDWRGSTELVRWRIESVANLCHSVSDGDHQAPPQTDAGIPFITISAINDGKLRLERATRFVPLPYFQAQKASRRPTRGDILFSVTGSIGIPALVDVDDAFTFQRHIAILKPNRSIVSSEYLVSALGSEDIRQQALAVATGTAQTTIPLNGLRSFAIPLPPLDEQTEIIRRVDSLFAYADRLEARYQAARAQVEKLTPATLAKAFRGELVPQDPNDEPASALLARIRAQRGEHTTTKPKRGRGRGRKAITA